MKDKEDNLIDELKELDSLLELSDFEEEPIDKKIEQKKSNKKEAEVTVKSDKIKSPEYQEKNKSKDIEELLKTGLQHYKTGQLEKAKIKFIEILHIEKSNAQALYNLGCIYIQKGLTENAIARFEDLLKVKPKDTHAMTNLAGLYYDNGDYEKALKILEKAVKLNPKDTYASDNLKVLKKISKSKLKKKRYF